MPALCYSHSQGIPDDEFGHHGFVVTVIDFSRMAGGAHFIWWSEGKQYVSKRCKNIYSMTKTMLSKKSTMNNNFRA